MKLKPYEKCIRSGATSLSDRELLSIVIGGSRGRSALDISSDILTMSKEYDGLVGLMHFDKTSYDNVEGVGEKKTAVLMAVAEISRRIWNRRKRKREIHLISPLSIMDYFKEDLRFLSYEEIHTIFLDGDLRLIKSELVSRGSAKSSLVSNREIFIRALRYNSNYIAVVHNHPSGLIKPSKEDIEFTRSLDAASKLINIKLLDHVIIGDNRYFSFKEQELI